jgi:hypothetical protein
MNFISNIGTLLTQPILNADTYKATHFTFEHPEFERSYGYIEARKGGEFDEVQFFGLQYMLRYYLTQRVTMDLINEAEAELTAHGVPFNREMWERILEARRRDAGPDQGDPGRHDRQAGHGSGHGRIDRSRMRRPRRLHRDR